MTDELKPCPLCGGAAAVWYFSDAQGYGVECSTASCGMEVTGCDNEAHAIRMWNTRPVEDALRSSVADFLRQTGEWIEQAYAVFLHNNAALLTGEELQQVPQPPDWRQVA